MEGGEGLIKDVLEGRMVGRMPRGRKRNGMLEELKEGSSMTRKRRAERRAEKREAWRDWVPNTCQ